MFDFFIETGDVLKVEAKIAKIAKIDITTKSRTIDVGEMQTLEMVGYDQDGNMFSTLEGVKFEWTIANNNGVFELVSIKVYKYIYIIYGFYLYVFYRTR